MSDLDKVLDKIEGRIYSIEKLLFYMFIMVFVALIVFIDILIYLTA